MVININILILLKINSKQSSIGSAREFIRIRERSIILNMSLIVVFLINCKYYLIYIIFYKLILNLILFIGFVRPRPLRSDIRSDGSQTVGLNKIRTKNQIGAKDKYSLQEHCIYQIGHTCQSFNTIDVKFFRPEDVLWPI
jgi:hypothetical protein